MKNLKRALSLVLSTAMLAGMMVVGAGAAHTDVKAEHNQEAIAVVTAAGIMGEGSEFNPDGTVDRHTMAVIMTHMLDLDTKDYAGAAPFGDVADWAAPYVDAAYANGIMSGIGNNQFGGTVKVTTAQAALMMLKALGYFEEAKLNDWKLDTIKMASKIDLLDGINAKADSVLTRNDVAQMILNALEANWVEETTDGGYTSIKGDNLSIEVYSGFERTEMDETLMVKLFDDRFEKAEDGETKLGLPAVVWYDNDEDEEIIAVAKDADEIVIATEETTALDLYVDEIDDDFDNDMNDLDVVAGDVVYYYEDDDKNIEAYAVTFELVEITDIDDDMTKGETKDGHSFLVELNDGEYEIYDDEFAGYDYEKGDYVLVVVDGDEVVASEKAEMVEGKIKSMKGGKYYIDGQAFENLSETELAVKDEIVAVLNKAGQIILVDEINEAVKSEDFAYIYNIVENDGDKNDDGVAADGTFTAYVVFADGTKGKYTLEDDSAEIAEIDGVYAYSINKDKELVIEDTDLTVAEGAAVLSNDNKFVTTDDGKVYANSKTEFVFAAWDDDKMVVTTATGIKNVDIDADVAVVYDADDKEALVVFVLAEDEGIESDAEYAVLMDTEYSYTVDEDDNEFYTYAVVVAGKETELTFEEELDLDEGEIFAYIVDGDYAVVSAAEYELVEGTINYEGENFIEIDGDEYTADDAEVYTVITVLDADGEYDYTEVKKNGKLEKDAEILFKANKDGEIELAFVLEIDD